MILFPDEHHAFYNFNKFEIFKSKACDWKRSCITPIEFLYDYRYIYEDH